VINSYCCDINFIDVEADKPISSFRTVPNYSYRLMAFIRHYWFLKNFLHFILSGEWHIITIITNIVRYKSCEIFIQFINRQVIDFIKVRMFLAVSAVHGFLELNFLPEEFFGFTFIKIGSFVGQVFATFATFFYSFQQLPKYSRYILFNVLSCFQEFYIATFSIFACNFCNFFDFCMLLFATFSIFACKIGCFKSFTVKCAHKCNLQRINATFAENKCNFLALLLQQKLALVI